MSQNSNLLEQIGEAAATQGTSGLIGAGMGLLLQKSNDRRQIQQQQKLTEMQLNANKSMARYNNELQLQMWHDTNYKPQVEELRKAGLNPGLLYGMGGAGGATTGNPGGSGVSGAAAPAGGQEIMGMMMNKAQIELIKAQTANIQADTVNKPKTGLNIEASTASLTQGIENQKAIEALTKIETQIKEIEFDWKPEIQQATLEKMNYEIMLLWNEKEISEQTLTDKIQLVKAQTTNAWLTGAAIKQGIQVDKARINQMTQEILQGWEGLDIRAKEQKIQEKFLQENINYMPVDRAIRGIDAISNAIPKGKGGMTRIETDKFDKYGNQSFERRTINNNYKSK